jgi:hypothetical protein
LAPWEGSMARCGGVATSAEGEAAPGRGKRGDNVGWADTNLTGPKIKKIHVVDSVATIER